MNGSIHEGPGRDMQTRNGRFTEHGREGQFEKKRKRNIDRHGDM